MSLINPTAVAALPSAPDPDDEETTFDTAAFAWASALPNWTTQLNTVASVTYGNAQYAAEQAGAAQIQAQAAAVSAQSAQAAQAAAQAAAGATMWAAPTVYNGGQVTWSPLNGQNYRRKPGSGAVAVDPSQDPANWWPLMPWTLPKDYVTDTGGTMYGVSYGGLNMINVIVFEGACSKQMPQSPNDGDIVVFKVLNGRRDNSVLVNAVNPIPFEGGITDAIVLDRTLQPTTLMYLQALNIWSFM